MRSGWYSSMMVCSEWGGSVLNARYKCQGIGMKTTIDRIVWEYARTVSSWGTGSTQPVSECLQS